jgi:hypothetical protein
LKILIETGNYNLQVDVPAGMTTQDIEVKRKQMEEEILSQIRNNQQILQDSKISWDVKVMKTRIL